MATEAAEAAEKLFADIEPSPPRSLLVRLRDWLQFVLLPPVRRHVRAHWHWWITTLIALAALFRDC